MNFSSNILLSGAGELSDQEDKSLISGNKENCTTSSLILISRVHILCIHHCTVLQKTVVCRLDYSKCVQQQIP